jgi:hypothetical protein
MGSPVRQTSSLVTPLLSHSVVFITIGIAAPIPRFAKADPVLKQKCGNAPPSSPPPVSPQPLPPCCCHTFNGFSVYLSLPTAPLQVHSLANGPEVVKPLLETSRKGYLAAMSASSYSYVSMLQRFGPIMNPGGAAISLTYIASNQVIPGYGGGMSSAKAVSNMITCLKMTQQNWHRPGTSRQRRWVHW